MSNIHRYQRFLITGGAGFIGRKLALQLAKNLENKIWIIDNLSPQIHGEDIQEPIFPSNINFIRGDIKNKNLIEKIIQDALPEVIVHMAAETGTGQSMYEITRYCDVNILGTSILLEAINKHGNNFKRFVLPSSRAIYGEGAYRECETSKLIVPPARTSEAMQSGQFIPTSSNGTQLEPISTLEDIPPAPSSIYASTKLMQEYLVIQAAANASWEATILRFQNVYGPGQSLNNPYTGVLSIFSSQILQKKKLNIYEDGNIVRDFIFIDDVVRAVELATQASLPHGTIINIGSGQATTILEAAKTLLNLYEKPENAYQITGDFRAGDIRHAVADISKANELLNWQPQVSLKQGLSELSFWCKKI